VPLTEGENTITLSAEDEFGNELTEGGSVTVVRQDFELSFPDDELPIDNPRKLVYDEVRERVLFGSITDTLIYAVDTNTGKRSAFLTEEMASDLSNIGGAYGLEIAPGGDSLLVLMRRLKAEGPGVLRIDLNTDEYEVLLTRDSQPDGQPDFTGPTSMRLDPENPDRAIALDNNGRRILSLDLTTGVRTLISSNDDSFSGPAMVTPNDLLIDAKNRRALVADIRGSRGLYWVDLETGDRTLWLSEGEPEGTPDLFVPSLAADDIEKRVLGINGYINTLWSVDIFTGEQEALSSPDLPHGYNELIRFEGMALSDNNEHLIGVDSVQEAVFVIDVETGERVILSKN